MNDSATLSACRGRGNRPANGLNLSPRRRKPTVAAASGEAVSVSAVDIRTEDYFRQQTPQLHQQFEQHAAMVQLLDDKVVLQDMLSAQRRWYSEVLGTSSYYDTNRWVTRGLLDEDDHKRVATFADKIAADARSYPFRDKVDYVRQQMKAIPTFAKETQLSTEEATDIGGKIDSVVAGVDSIFMEMEGADWRRGDKQAMRKISQRQHQLDVQQQWLAQGDAAHRAEAAFANIQDGLQAHESQKYEGDLLQRFDDYEQLKASVAFIESLPHQQEEVQHLLNIVQKNMATIMPDWMFEQDHDPSFERARQRASEALYELDALLEMPAVDDTAPIGNLLLRRRNPTKSVQAVQNKNAGSAVSRQAQQELAEELLGRRRP